METKNVNSLALSYIKGLKKAYAEVGGKDVWQNLETVAFGANEQDIQELKEIYPEVPDSLIGLLKLIDGTYFREYEGDEITMYFLGSDVEDGEYPYYLLSAKEIVKNKNIAYEYYADYVNRVCEEDDVIMDDRIINDAERMNWLHFSDCMNNGGTSQLFIDFSPSEEGVKGQIIRFLHDPDEMKVIADSFDEYLKMLMDNEYAFINENSIDE